MSGGYFGYKNYSLDEIADKLEDVINNRTEWHDYSSETFNVFCNTLDALRTASISLRRIDWLLSGDDSENTFHERLKSDLNEYNKTR